MRASSSSSFAAALLPLVLLGGAALVAASSSSPSSAGAKKFSYLIIREDCVETFFTRLNFFDVDCLKATISKAVGFGIILGAVVVKVPTILKIRARGSVDSISSFSLYQELLSNILASVWNVLAGNPFSAYGETIIVALGTFAVTALVWQYRNPGAGHILAVLAGLAAISAAAFWTPQEHMDTLLYSYNSIFAVSRVTQIVEVLRTSSMGANAFLTLFMNFAGTAGRVFTSSQEVKSPLHFRISAFNALLNGVLVAQFVWYTTLGHGKDAAPAPAAAKPAAADKPASKKAAAAAEAAAKPAAIKAPASSGSSRKGGSSRDASPAASPRSPAGGLVQRRSAAK